MTQLKQEGNPLDSQWICTGCGIFHSKAICPNCGTSRLEQCPSCYHEPMDTWLECSKCGHREKVIKP